MHSYADDFVSIRILFLLLLVMNAGKTACYR